MMGRQVANRERAELISLEEVVPKDHLLRAVDRYLDLTEFREHLARFYSHTGRPSVDPELLIRMLIIGYCYGIRSERRLCEEVSSTGETLNRSVREYLAALDAANFTPPKSISLTDPAASWTAATGRAIFAYSTNYLVDVKAGVIVDVEASSSNHAAEVMATRTMLDRVEHRFQMKPDRLIGDTAYGSTSMLAWLVEDKEIAPHVPVWDKASRDDGTFMNSDFEWDAKANEYRCPGGRALRSDWRSFKNSRSRVTKDETTIYRSRHSDCAACKLKERCCPNTQFRKIARSIHETSRNVARDLASTLEYQHSRCERKKVEMLFAHLKPILKLDRLRLRGRSGANDEFLLAATAQNLRRMAKQWVCSQSPLNST